MIKYLNVRIWIWAKNIYKTLIPKTCLIFFAFLILVISSCEKVFEPSIKNVGSSVVVEGSLSTVAGAQNIQITWSQSYNGVSKYSGLSGAEVYVSDDNRKVISFSETGNAGNYSTYPDTLAKAEIGRSYTLHIKTQSGDEYESLPQTVVKCAPIDSIFCEHDVQDVLELDVYGDAYQVKYDGIRVEENTKGLYPDHNFYLYSWKGYEEFVIGFYMDYSLVPAYMHTSLQSKYYKVICTGNADDYANQELLHNKLLFISSADLEKRPATVPDTLLEYISLIPGGPLVPYYFKDSIEFVTFEGLILRLEQKSISNDAYVFWNSVQKQLDANGRLFDPVSSQIEGNITCTSDPAKKAFGVFYAYDVSERYAWLYIDKNNNVNSKVLDSLPVISPDTLTWVKPPKGWIGY